MKDRKITVHVSPSADPIRKYEFRMSDGAGGSADLVFNKTNDNMKKNENYNVIFSLQNEGDAKLQFSQDPQTVLWAKPIASRTDPCPDTPCYMPGVFEINASKIGKSKIEVINTDPEVQDFAFALNFLEQGKKDGPDAVYYCYDPLGSNQNGGLPLFGSSSMIVGAVGGALVGLIFAAVTLEALTTQAAITYGLVGGIGGLAIAYLLSGR